MYLKYLMGLSLCILFQGCASQSYEQAETNAVVSPTIISNQKIKQHLADSVYAYTKDQTAYQVAFDDLNKDGHADAIVLLSGMNWCGSGGCTLLIFQGGADHQFKFVSKSTVVDTPIYSTVSMHKGWKQLSVYVRKHGQVILPFDGQAYAENPSLLPIQTLELTPENAQLLLTQ